MLHKNLKRTLLYFCIILMLGVVLTACGNTSSNNKSNTKAVTSSNKNKDTKSENSDSSVKQDKKAPLDALKDAFKEAGLQVGDNETLAYDMIGATAGYKFKINDQLIEIYYYDESKLNDSGKKFLEQAKNGSINMSGISLPVKYNNNFVIARLDEHKDKDKILEVFNSFKY